MTEAELVAFNDAAAGWEQALYAFLAEKERRSGSMRTVDAYSRTLQRFFGALGSLPDEVTSRDVFAFAHGCGPSGREPAPITIGSRLACISSFYRFLIRMKLATSNPCDEIERPRASPSPPRGLNADEIRRLLAVMPRTPQGLRDRAITVTLVLTGRRRSEILNLKAGNISVAGGLFYTYRGKGGKKAKRELPRPAFDAIESALAAWGKSLAAMGPNESLWPSRHPSREGGGIRDSTYYASLKRYLAAADLPSAGVHILDTRRRSSDATRDRASRMSVYSSIIRRWP